MVDLSLSLMSLVHLDRPLNFFVTLPLELVSGHPLSYLNLSAADSIIGSSNL